MISMAPAQDRTAQIVRDPIVDTGHRAWLPNPRLFPTQGGFRKRDLRCSLCQAGLRGHLTYPRACTKIRVRGCFLSYSAGGSLLPCRVWSSCEKSLGSFRSQRVFSKRDLRCSLCQAGLRGYLTCQRACTKIRVRGCFLSDSTGGGLLPRVWGSCEKSLGSFRSQRVLHTS